MRIPRLTTHAALLVTVSLALLTTPACILGFDADSVELQDPDDQDASGDLAADTAADTADEGVEDLPPDAPADTGADITPDAEPDITPDVEPDASPDMAPDDLPEDLPADADPDLPGDLADPDLAPDLVDPDLSPDLPGDLADAPDGEDPCPAGDACDPGFAGALGVCQDGACAFDRCEDGRGDCNNSLTIDGCEVSLESDVAHCGVCGRGCAAPNAEVSCAQGECQIASCAQGYEDLNRLAEDGCEAQRPMRARITGVDPINHGARVQWELVGEGAAPAWFELRWGTSPTNLEWSRRVPAARAVNLTATIGPLLEEGEWHFRVLTWSQEELSGELSEVFSEVWAPEGWFVRSPALFASALEAEGSAFGVYAGLGSVGHVLDGGAAVIPSHQAPPAAMFYLDMLYEGPEAGLGAMVGTDGQIQRTQDWGVSWASVSSPTTQDLSDVAITREGHLLVLGQGAQIHYSEDQGQRWGVVEETPPGVTLWTAAQALEVDGRRGPVYVTGAGEEEVVIGVVEGGRFEALPYAPTRLVYFFGLHMVTPEVGYAAGFQTLVRTQDGWRSHEVVELPDLLQEDILARVSASADGERVLVGSFYGNFWWSEDGGDSFVRVALPSLGNQEDNGWGAFAALGDQGGPPWLIMSSEGHRARWQPGQTGYALEGLAEGIWGDFVDAALGGGSARHPDVDGGWARGPGGGDAGQRAGDAAVAGAAGRDLAVAGVCRHRADRGGDGVGGGDAGWGGAVDARDAAGQHPRRDAAGRRAGRPRGRGLDRGQQPQRGAPVPRRAEPPGGDHADQLWAARPGAAGAGRVPLPGRGDQRRRDKARAVGQRPRVVPGVARRGDLAQHRLGAGL